MCTKYWLTACSSLFKLAQEKVWLGDRTVTLNKVNLMLRDSLKLKTVKIVSCERKSSKSKKTGVIKVTIDTADQKQEIMQIKNRLKNTPKYKHVYKLFNSN